MAPLNLRKLINQQKARLGEMQLLQTRFLAKETNTLNKAMVQSRLDSVKTILEEVRRTHADILAKDDSEDDPYITDHIYDVLHAKYEEVNDALLTARTQFEVSEETTVRPSASSTPTPNPSEQIIPQLPHVPLPTFSGKYEDWESFSDLFTSLVHENSRYSDAAKLQFLKSCLKDSAAELVAGVKTTNANYVSTWNALQARYFNPRLIIFKHMSALLQIPYLKQESAVGLRSFADEAQRIVRALTNLKLPVEQWHLWLVLILSERLDHESRKIWEAELSAKDRQALSRLNTEGFNQLDHLPTFPDFVEFLEKRAQTLNMLNSDHTVERASERRGEKRNISEPRYGLRTKKALHVSSQASPTSTFPNCAFCAGSHSIYKCFKFKAKSSEERRHEARRLKLCFNCLGSHLVNACKSPSRCSIANCGEKHHTLLHRPPANTQVHTKASTSTNSYHRDGPNSEEKGVKIHTANIASSKCRVVLATAQLGILGLRNNQFIVRALLDQGAETSFISESIVQLLELPKYHTDVSLTGIGGNVAGKARAYAKIKIRSLIDPKFQVDTEALILPRLTSQIPGRPIIELDIRRFKALPLADPQFTTPNSVDLILGADVYGRLLRSGLKRLHTSHLIAQNTVFGWIISGSIQEDAPRRAEGATPAQTHILHCATQQSLDLSLRRFWELEEVPTSTITLNPEDQACEELFQRSHKRNANGQYTVCLPVKPDLPEVSSETRRMALGSLSSMYRRFSRDSKLAQSYRDFMKIYEELGHMTRIPEAELNSKGVWYLPHHAVVQSSDEKWKLRVVFDASRQTREGHSLNKFLMRGPPPSK